MPNEYGQATNATRRAVLELPKVKKTIKSLTRKAENIVYTATGLTRKELVYVSWAIPVAQGKLSTKPFKKFKMSGDDWVLKPEVEYKISDQNVESMLLFNYQF